METGASLVTSAGVDRRDDGALRGARLIPSGAGDDDLLQIHRRGLEREIDSDDLAVGGVDSTGDRAVADPARGDSVRTVGDASNAIRAIRSRGGAKLRALNGDCYRLEGSAGLRVGHSAGDRPVARLLRAEGGRESAGSREQHRRKPCATFHRGLRVVGIGVAAIGTDKLELVHWRRKRHLRVNGAPR